MTWRLAAGLVWCFMLVSPDPGVAEPLPANWDAQRFMPIEDVKAGLRGVGRTVLRGDSIETFEVEILGVLETSFPRGHMILARCSGLNLENTGIAAGMSGSPIFIDGKLIGALAFGWPFATEPITGITPIAEMMALGARSGGEDFLPSARSGYAPEAWEALFQARGTEALSLVIPDPLSGSATMPPLQVPISMSGFSGEASRLAQGILGDRGFLAVQGGSTSSSVSDAPVQAGSAIAVELLRGDAQMAAIGTVTWTSGNDVYAFGHPMLDRGASAYPMARAEILTIMPRLNSSFKMGAVGAPLGAITRDYRAGIMGRVGPAPRMIPMNMTLELPTGQQDFHFELLDGEGLTPAIAGITAMNTVHSAARAAGPATQQVTIRLELTDGRKVTRRSIVAGFSPPGELAGEVARLVGLIHGNPFEPVVLREIHVEVSVREEVHAAFLDALVVESSDMAPGTTLQLELTLRDYRGERFTETMELKIPSTVSPGTYRVQVCDGERDDRAEQERAPGRFIPESLDDLLRLLEAESSFDVVHARLLGGGSHPVVRGHELPQLPGSAQLLLRAPRTAGLTSQANGTVYGVSSTRFDKVILGCQVVPITVVAPSGKE